MAKKHSTDEAPSSKYKELSEILNRVDDELYALGALAAASASLVVNSEHGEQDNGLAHATTLLYLMEEQAMKLAAAVGLVRLSHLLAYSGPEQRAC